MVRADDGDEVLAAAAAKGDRAALDALLRRHAGLIHAVCRRVLANPDDALDASQDALLAIARRIDTFDGRSKFTTWCYRVATNAALDEARRRSRRPAPAETLPEPREHDGARSTTPSPTGSTSMPHSVGCHPATGPRWR